MDVGSIDIDSPDFETEEYVTLRQAILDNPNEYCAFRVHGNRIYIRLEPKKYDVTSDLSVWKLWIPTQMTESLVQKEHDEVLGAHGGIRKTLERLRRHYFWPHMARQVRDYIGKCEVCKTSKAPNSSLKPPMGQPYKIERPWQRLYVDLLGPYPRSKMGKTMILIVLDHLTKFVLLKAISRGTASQIVTFLEDEVFLVYGVPQSIHTDNGVQFRSQDYRDLLKRYGVKDSKTAIYSPQSNAAERVNRSVLAAVRSYITKSKHTTWDQHLSQIACAIRNSYHESIGQSPHFMLFWLS